MIVQTFFMPRSKGWFYITICILSIIGLFLYSLGIFVLLKTSHIYLGGIFAFAFLGILLLSFFIYSLFRFIGIRSGARLELDDAGITIFKNEQNRMFMKWEEIDELKNSYFVPGATITDRSKLKKMFIDFRFNDFNRIMDRLVEEMVKRMILPDMPIRFGYSSVFFTFIYSVVTLLLVAIIFLYLYIRHYSIINYIVYCLLIIFGISQNKFYFKAIYLEEKGITLFRLFDKIEIPWDELEKVQGGFFKLNNGRMLFKMGLLKRGQKSFFLINGLSRKPRIYIILKKAFEKFCPRP